MANTRRRTTLLLVICNLVLGLFWLYSRTQYWLNPPSEEGVLLPWTIPLAKMSLAVFAVFVVAEGFMLAGRRAAAIVMMGTLFVITADMVARYAEHIWWWITVTKESGFPITPWTLWDMTGAGRWTFWCGLNYWYFILRGKGEGAPALVRA